MAVAPASAAPRRILERNCLLSAESLRQLATDAATLATDPSLDELTENIQRHGPTREDDLQMFPITSASRFFAPKSAP